MAAGRARILHVVSDTNFGGAGRYLLTLLGRPEYTSQVSLEVACPSPGLLWDNLKGAGVHTYALPGGDRSLDPGQLTPLFSIIAHGHYDIIHTHASLTARIVARLFPGLRIVFTKHTLGGAGSQGRISAVLQRLLADRVICPSRAVLDQMKDVGLPESMLDLIYNGVDVEQIRHAAERSRAEATPEAHSRASPVIVSTGRLEPEKGHECLIRAMPLVLRSHPSARLVIAGDGSLSEHLRAVSLELSVAPSVIFPGFVEDVPSLLAQASVFVLPSLSEALGISLLEAMAAGTPVVGSDTGGIPEVIESGSDGLLTPPGEPEPLAQAITQILSDRRLAHSLASRAQVTVSTRFSAASQARETITTYSNTLAKSARPKRS